MFYIWFVLQFAPPCIALWIHQQKTQETYFTKETTVKTVADFLVISFFILIFVVTLMFFFQPKHEFDIQMFSGGNLTDLGFLMQYAIFSLLASVAVGSGYSMDFLQSFQKKPEESADSPEIPEETERKTMKFVEDDEEYDDDEYDDEEYDDEYDDEEYDEEDEELEEELEEEEKPQKNQSTNKTSSKKKK